MTARLLATAAVVTLALAGCGGNDGTTTVDGQTAPPAASTPTTSTTPPAPVKLDAAAQLAKLKPCVGGEAAETFQWFQPTVDYAKSMGGDGFTVTLDGKPVTLIVFPYAEAAQLGFKDIQDRLIALEQKRPTDYATVAATAAQAIGNVLEVASQGALSPRANDTVMTCIQQSST